MHFEAPSPRTKSSDESRPLAEAWSLARAMAPFEFPLKRSLFNCRLCGSCLLSQTRLICPMTCPKGLRNGPCGGTLDGMCEVLPEQACVWMRIRARQGAEKPDLHRPIDPGLFGASSAVNFLSGADLATRVPITLTNESHRVRLRPRSGLEALLAFGKPAVTVEMQSPRTLAGLDSFSRRIEPLLPLVDAFNTTSGAGGHGGVSSRAGANVVTRMGGEAILQICGRDVSPAEFVGELDAASGDGIANVLCLTGDWPVASARTFKSAAAAREKFFPMDASQMIYEARRLSEKKRSAFAPEAPFRGSPFFVGGAANPVSTPMETAVGRIWQKVACGADFIQTQVVFDVEGFCEWREQLLKHPAARRLYLLASIPVLGKPSALEIVPRIPGVFLPTHLKESLQLAESFEKGARDLARSVMAQLVVRRAVHGFHLIPFGATTSQMVEMATFARDLLNDPPPEITRFSS